MKNKLQSAYPFPLNFYRELCLEMGLPMPDTMSADEEKGLMCIVDYIKYDEFMSILIERLQLGRTFKNIGKDRGYTNMKASSILRQDLKRLIESYYIGLIFGYEKFVMNSSVEDLHLTSRSLRALIRNDINTLDDIRKFGRANLKNLRYLGEASYNEIIFKTWFLWDSENQLKLSQRHKDNIRASLSEKGWKTKEISELITYIEDN